jgi:hypothetical protein
MHKSNINSRMGLKEMESLMVIEQWTDKDRRGTDPDSVSR